MSAQTGDQIPLNLSAHAPSYRRSDFFCSAANQLAFNWVTGWPHWPDDISMVNISGPSGCGKTHLFHLSDPNLSFRIDGSAVAPFERAQNWLHEYPSADTSLCFLLDADETLFEVNAEACFHFLNSIKSSRHGLIIFSQSPVAQCETGLADLDSRLRAITAQPITSPDDELLVEILIKQAFDYQLLLPRHIARYIVEHSERSFPANALIISELNDMALSRKKPVTMALARELVSNNTQTGQSGLLFPSET